MGFELTAEHPFFHELRRFIYHATPVSEYVQIKLDGFIRPFDSLPPEKANYPKDCRCRQLRSISMFDFTSTPIEEIFHQDCSRHWQGQLRDCMGSTPLTKPSKWTKVLIGFDSKDLKDNLLSHSKVRSLTPDGGPILPKVEVCYQGIIALNMAKQVIAFRSSDFNDYQIFEGGFIKDCDLLKK